MVMPKTSNKKKATTSKRHCGFCVRGVLEIDYKDSKTVQRFISSYGKIVARKRSGVCAFHQRKLALAIKHARHMGLVPFVVS